MSSLPALSSTVLGFELGSPTPHSYSIFPVIPMHSLPHTAMLHHMDTITLEVHASSRFSYCTTQSRLHHDLRQNSHCFKSLPVWVCERTQHVKGLAAKPEDMSSILRAHRVRREN